MHVRCSQSGVETQELVYCRCFRSSQHLSSKLTTCSKICLKVGTASSCDLPVSLVPMADSCKASHCIPQLWYGCCLDCSVVEIQFSS